MSNYPFETFPLTKRVGIVNPASNLDARYGPWLTYNDALTAFSSVVREVGLTVAVSGIDGIVEYWYKNGITDNDLVLKSGDITEADILPTVTNYLSTNSILLCSIDVKNQILSAGTDLLNIFLTEDSDSQTLTYTPSSYELTISNGNTVNLSSVVVSPSANALFQTVSAAALSGVFYGDGSNLLGVSPAAKLYILNENENTLSAGSYNTFFKTVSSDTTLLYFDITNGQTITLYLSANHETVKRHTLPSPTFLSNVSEANEIYTYNGYITKTTIQRIGNEYYGVSNIIKTDIAQNPGIIGRLVLDQSSGFLVQENSDRLLLEIN